MPPPFIGRRHQLGKLQTFGADPSTQMATVCGRQGSGKSTLLLRSLELEKRGMSVYHQAAQLTAGANYRRFRHDMLQVLTPLLLDGPTSDITHAQDWRSMILALGQSARELGSLTVVIDDFPHLSRADSTLEGVFHEALERSKALGQPLKLVLCGRAARQSDTLLLHNSVLHSDSGLNLTLMPFDYLESVEFTPAWTLDQLVQARTVFGGMPQYLALLDDQVSVGKNYERLVLDPSGPLHEEADGILMAEVTELRVYASILMAIASGKSRAREIISAAGIHPSSLQKYIERLEDLGLVRRVGSANAVADTRNVRYVVADPFVASSYRYVLPNLSALRAHGGQGTWQKIVAPALDRDPNAVPAMFEDICRQWTAQHMQEFWKGEFGEVGQIFQGGSAPNVEIDVACRLGSGAQISWLLGECKWNENAQGGDVLRRLQDSGQKVIGPVPVQQWVLFNRGGFQPDLTTRVPERTRLVSLPELYGRQ